MDRKIRSTLSQLALNGALVKKLEQEQNELTQVFQEGGQRLEQGKAPTVEAEREWDRQERIKAIKEADMQQQRCAYMMCSLLLTFHCTGRCRNRWCTTSTGNLRWRMHE